MELDYITLENGIDYGVIETLILDENKYLFLVNEKDEKDVTVRKIKIKDGEEYLFKLDSNDELENVLNAFYDKKSKRMENDEK